MQTTCLLEKHQTLGAKMVNFANWNMPLHYGSQLNEHTAVREKVGCFDVSHMCQVELTGLNVEPFLRYLLANDVIKLSQPGRALYSCMLNPEGGIKDDLIVYKISDQNFRLVVNAGCCDKDLDWINAEAKEYQVKVKNLKNQSIIALQGPFSESILSAYYPALDLARLRPFHFIHDTNLLIARTGYTGEIGFEIMLEHPEAQQLWSWLIEKKVQPCGLAARDSLRLEAGFNLYGQDMTEDTSPYESNLGWTVSLKDPQRNFIGRQAVEKTRQDGAKQQLKGLVLKERALLRHGQKVLNSKLDEVGVITSGGFSPSTGYSIAMARVDKKTNGPLFVRCRDKEYPVSCIALPFIKKGQPCC